MPLTLPLGNVQIKEASLDGAAAHLRSVRSVQGGFQYQLEVQGRGPHTILLRFQAPVTVSGENRDLALTIPELAQSRLTFDASVGAHYLHDLAGRGCQRVGAAPGDSRGVLLETDLGRVNKIHLRWRQENGPAQQPTVRVREGYLWELRPTGSSLFAALQYHVERGAVNDLTLELPDQVEVRSVEAGALPQAGAIDAAPPRLQAWSVSRTGRQRHLQVQFQQPITAGVQLTLELVPRLPLGPNVLLPVPRPMDAQPLEEKGAEPLLAYHVEGWSAAGGREFPRHASEQPRRRSRVSGTRPAWEIQGRTPTSSSFSARAAGLRTCV